MTAARVRHREHGVFKEPVGLGSALVFVDLQTHEVANDLVADAEGRTLTAVEVCLGLALQLDILCAVVCPYT